MKEKRLIPFGEKITLDDLPCGAMFAFGDDCVAVKSEYRCDNGLIEAFIVDSGEQFWGGVHTAKEQNELMVQPLTIEEVDVSATNHQKIKQIPKNTFDAILAMNRKYWKSGDHDFIQAELALCSSLEKETGISWGSFTNLVSSIVQPNGFKEKATNATIYEVLRALGYEVVEDGKEHPTE